MCNLHIYISLRSFWVQLEEWVGGRETREEAVTGIEGRSDESLKSEVAVRMGGWIWKRFSR